jgi:hypothetical protein
MTIFTDDADLDAQLRASDPVNRDALERVADAPGAMHLRTAISRAPKARRRRRFMRPAILVAAAAAATGVSLSLTLVHPASEGSAFGAALVRFAENSPRLLVGAGGWHVTRADEEDAHTGEMTFSAGKASLDVFWVAGAGEKESDKADMTHVGSAQIDGTTAWVGAYDAHEFEAIWSVGDQAREARGNFAAVADFLAVADTLHRVDVDTWLAAMPASVVDPSSRAATVLQMLADVPQPDGFNVAKLDVAPGVSDRYQLGAQVIGTVSCAWIHQWTHGTSAERVQASRAMATSRHWAILQEMEAQGAYPDVVWSIADAMNGKPLQMTPGETLEEWSQPALGC